MTAGAVTVGIHPPVHAHVSLDRARTVVDVTSRAGLKETNESFSANPFDFDADGDKDVLVVYHDQGGKLWRNDRGAFTRVARSAFPATNESDIPIDRHDCAWADVNRDRRADVFCSVGRGSGGALKRGDHPDNELWIQRSDGSFVDRGTEWGVGDPYGRGRDAVFLDANGDRWPDLYVGNALPRSGDIDGVSHGSSKLFLNRGGARFVGAPAFGLDRRQGGDCALAADVDEDGDEDVVTCGQYGVRIYHNQAHRRFSDATVASGFPIIAEAGVRKTQFYTDVDLADMDKDGDLDLVGIRGDRLTCRLNDGRGRFPTRRSRCRSPRDARSPRVMRTRTGTSTSSR